MPDLRVLCKYILVRAAQHIPDILLDVQEMHRTHKRLENAPPPHTAFAPAPAGEAKTAAPPADSKI